LISIIIPIKNEPYLPTLLKELNAVLKQPHEILIQTEPGLSNAVMQGIKKACGDIIVVMDGDGSHPPNILPEMLKLFDKYDIVLGSRYVKGAVSDYTIKRKIISLIFRDIAILLFQPKVKDVLSGYVIAKKVVYNNISMNPKGYKFGLELILKAKGKYKITEYPVHIYERKAGKSKADLNQGIETLRFMAKLFKEKYM